MLDMIEKQNGGGLTLVESMRYVKANNKYLPYYNPNADETYIVYWDANNLYGHAMVQSLPYNNLQFEQDITLR